MDAKPVHPQQVAEEGLLEARGKEAAFELGAEDADICAVQPALGYRWKASGKHFSITAPSCAAGPAEMC